MIDTLHHAEILLRPVIPHYEEASCLCVLGGRPRRSVWCLWVSRRIGRGAAKVIRAGLGDGLLRRVTSCRGAVVGCAWLDVLEFVDISIVFSTEIKLRLVIAPVLLQAHLKALPELIDNPIMKPMFLIKLIEQLPSVFTILIVSSPTLRPPPASSSRSTTFSSAKLPSVLLNRV